MPVEKPTPIQAVVIGVSAGGLAALGKMLPALDANFPAAVIIVQHVSPKADDFLIRHLNDRSRISVKEAEEKEEVRPGMVYIAPPNYHLLVEDDKTLSFSVGPRVKHSRPSVDVLFESAARTFRDALIGVILTGASADGSAGLLDIRKRGGLAIVQDPTTAESEMMPQSALTIAGADHVLPLEEIGPFLNTWVAKSHD